MFHFTYHDLFVIVDDTQRNINLQLSSVKKSLVELSPHAFIHSFLHVNSLKLPYTPWAICHYENQIYCSFQSSHKIVRIDQRGNQFEWVLYSSDTKVESILAKNDKIFVDVTKNNNPKIFVYDLSCQLITSWQYPDCSSLSYRNKLAVIGNQVIVGDVSNERLNVYSLTGDIIRHIPCTQLLWRSSICEAGDDSVIITNWWSDKVYKLSLTTGQIEWTSTDVIYLAAVVCYADQYVLVAILYASTINVLDINTGK